MMPTSVFILMMVLLPIACFAMCLLGAWIAHRCSKQLSPIPDIPMCRIRSNGEKKPAEQPTPRKASL